MKKIIISGAFMLACATGTALGQSTQVALNTEKNELKVHQKDRKAKEKEVTYFTRDHFERDFPDAQNVYYHAGKYYDEVNYTVNGVFYTAYYDEQSDLVGTTTEKQITDLPESAQKEIIKRWTNKGYTIDKVVLFDDNEANDSDMYLYGSRFDDQDVYFVEISKDGKQTVLQAFMDGTVAFFMNLRD